MKEQRIDFPDYTAENQERDAKRFEEHQKKDVYIIKVRGHYGAYMPDGEDYISYGNHEAKDLTEFYKHAHKYFEKLVLSLNFTAYTIKELKIIYYIKFKYKSF